MPVFEYAGTNETGANVNGLAHGESLDAVARQLASQGITVHQLGVASGTELGDSKPSGPVRAEQPRSAPTPPPTEERSPFQTQFAGRIVSLVPLTALQFFFSQLGTLLDAGINPADALETLTRQTSNHKLTGIIKECKEHVIVGRPISAGLQRYPEVFTPLMLSMVRVGEEGGFLAEQCRTLSEYIHRDVELRNMIKRETAMPKLTVYGSIGIILGTNLIIQTVAPGGVGLPMPWIVWVLALIVVVGGYLFTKLALPQPQIRRAFDDIVLKIPGVGGMVHGFAMAKFGRAFGALYKGGVALPRAVQMAADACGNESVRARVRPAAKTLEEGGSITETFGATNAFSPLVLDMSRTGETTGDMDRMLEKMSEFYEEEGALKAQMAAKFIGVVSLLLVAAYVCMVLLAFYSSYFGRITSGAG